MVFSWKEIEAIMYELNRMLGMKTFFADSQGNYIVEDKEPIPGFDVKEFLKRSREVFFNEKGGIAAVHIDGGMAGALIVDGLRPDMESQLLMAKRLMELMLGERFRKDQENTGMLNRRDLVKQWIFNRHVGDDNSFETRMAVAGIDTSDSYVVAVLRILTKELEAPDTAMLARIRNLRSNYMDRLEHLVDCIIVRDKMVFLFQSDDDVCLQNNLRILKNIMESSYPIHVCGGIGQISRNYTQVHDSYGQADRACAISQKSRQTQIMRYDELSIDLLVDEISPQIKKDFVDKVFGGCKKSDIEEWKILLKAFFISNGSIGKVAEELFMHKNTLQYKLNKIREQTGYDPRSTCDALKLYLAILFSSDFRC